MDRVPTVEDFLKEILPDVDRELSEEGFELQLRPVHAAVRAASTFVMGVRLDGEETVPDFGNLDFMLEKWFRGFYQLTEEWYRDRFGAAFDQKPARTATAFVVAFGVPFRVAVPLTVISPAEPGKTVWLQMPDHLLPEEDAIAWIEDPPNFSSLGERERQSLRKDVKTVATLHRQIASHLLGLRLESPIARRFAHAVRSHLGDAPSQVVDRWQHAGTAKMAWEMQMVCECALKAVAAEKVGKFRESHDLFRLYDDVEEFVPKLKRHSLKRLPRCDDVIQLRYGQGPVPNLGDAFKIYITALSVAEVTLGGISTINLGEAAFKIQRPPWMVPLPRQTPERE